MSQFGLPDPNDNVLEEGNKLICKHIESGNGNEACRRINEGPNVNISPHGTGRAAFTYIFTIFLVV